MRQEGRTKEAPAKHQGSSNEAPIRCFLQRFACSRSVAHALQGPFCTVLLNKNLDFQHPFFAILWMMVCGGRYADFHSTGESITRSGQGSVYIMELHNIEHILFGFEFSCSFYVPFAV